MRVTSSPSVDVARQAQYVKSLALPAEPRASQQGQATKADLFLDGFTPSAAAPTAFGSSTLRSLATGIQSLAEKDSRWREERTLGQMKNGSHQGFPIPQPDDLRVRDSPCVSASSFDPCSP